MHRKTENAITYCSDVHCCLDIVGVVTRTTNESIIQISDLPQMKEAVSFLQNKRLFCIHVLLKWSYNDILFILTVKCGSATNTCFQNGNTKSVVLQECCTMYSTFWQVLNNRMRFQYRCACARARTHRIKHLWESLEWCNEIHWCTTTTHHVKLFDSLNIWHNL